MTLNATLMAWLADPMSVPSIEQDGLELILQDIKRNIKDNQQFLEFLKDDRDVLLPDEDSDDPSDVDDDDFEEL